jgi:hypothetical protein
MSIWLTQNLSGILDEARHLQETLEPRSHLHPRDNLGDDCEWDVMQHLEPLRNVVMKTMDLFKRLSDPEAPSDEFELAWNGIMPHSLQEKV